MSNPQGESFSPETASAGEAENQQHSPAGEESAAEPVSQPEESDPDDWIPEYDLNPPATASPSTGSASVSGPQVKDVAPLIMVETAFLASTASLIWLINYYFPLGPVLRIFFPVPIALVYLRWGARAAWMGALVSGLLLAVLMGPTRSILFVMPFGLLGVLLGGLWRRGAGWNFSILMGTLVGSFGVFFRIWLLSILLGEDLWVYLTSQITELTEWIFERLGLLAQPELALIQAIVLAIVLLNNVIYLFAVHLAACLLLERLGNPIPPPPPWVQVLLTEE